MRPDERSRDVFEEIPGYEKPPLPPLPPVDDYASLARQGFVRLTPISRCIIGTALRAVRYKRFHDELPARAEEILRGTNMRESRLFAPAFSATAALADDPRTLDALQRAATLIVGARTLCRDTMSGQLEMDRFRGAPLEMGQYPNAFSTVALIDGRTRLFKGKRFDRVGVMVRRRPYVLELGEDVAPAESVLQLLQDLVSDAHAASPVRDEEAPAILTAAKTRTLTAALKAMERSEENATTLAALRDCHFVICLDLDQKPTDHAASAFLTHAANPANRWYLSSLQIVVFGNAKAAAIFSFLAYLDGNVMSRCAAELWQRASKVTFGGSSAVLPPARPIAFRVNARHVRKAWREVRAVQDDQQATYVIRAYGRDAFKERGLDPVSAFVAALAYATKRASGVVPDILQLLSISKYRCTPLGAAMVTTTELQGFLDALERSVSGGRGKLLEAAIASHLRECRAEREHLSLRWPVEAFLRSRRGLAKAWTLGVFGAAALGLAVTRSLGKKDVVISHPQIYPEIPVFGRPGVRLPYANCFGLHYQIYEKEIVMTFIPGLRWRTPNAAFAREIERAIGTVLDVARET